jgi:hypothetical protein
MKKILMLVFALLFSFTLFISHPQSSYASKYAFWPGNYVLNGGVGNNGYNTRYYYISPSSSTYASLINSAMSTWVNTTTDPGVTTPIYYRNTTTKSASVMDIYNGSYYSYASGILGETLFYRFSALVEDQYGQPNQNWGWNEIHLNNPRFEESTFTTFNRQGTIAHEMGHAMGLAHYTDPYVIMSQYNNGYRKVNRPSLDDLYGINVLY